MTPQPPVAPASTQLHCARAAARACCKGRDSQHEIVTGTEQGSVCPQGHGVPTAPVSPQGGEGGTALGMVQPPAHQNQRWQWEGTADPRGLCTDSAPPPGQELGPLPCPPSTLASSGVMVAHLTATLYFWVASAESMVTWSSVLSR